LEVERIVLGGMKAPIGQHLHLILNRRGHDRKVLIVDVGQRPDPAAGCVPSSGVNPDLRSLSSQAACFVSSTA
ncbi:MAG: hypothetical protein R3202_08715, partial [Candidatus Competibacterales bacterium]|nr:hypothetical protein [Candidatus Competibacterales bacterium]